MKKIMVKFVFVIAILLLLSLGVSAAETEHRVFTQAELQGQVPLDDVITTEVQELDRFGSLAGFEKVYAIEGVAEGESVDYYLPSKSGFFLLTSPTNSTLSRTFFSAGNSNGHINQKWRFTPDGYGDYVVYSCAYPTKCLTVNYSTLEVTLSEYTGSQFQKWGIYSNTTSGHALVSEAISQSNGAKLLYGSSGFSVSYSNYTPICYFTAADFVPTESVTIETAYIGENRSKAVKTVITPANATIKPDSLLGIWEYNPAHGYFTVSSTGYLTGKKKGTHYVMYTDPMTKVNATAMINVLDHVVNLDVLYDKGYAYRYSGEIPRISNAMNILQEKYASEFGIYVDWSYPTEYTSLADECPYNDINGDGAYTILDSGGYDVRCTCGGSSCVNHHKSIYNVLDDVDDPNLSETLRVAFIGHDMCGLDYNNNHVINYDTRGLTDTSLGKFAIFTLADDEETVAYNNRRIMTVVHELGHLYDTDDHTMSLELLSIFGPELYAQYIAAGCSDNCIYGANKNDPDIYNNLVFCDMCKAKVEENISRYDHK